MTTRVLLADDHAVLRAGLKLLLESEPDIRIVAQADDGVEAVRLTEQLQPDVVVMDISMPKLDGLAAMAEIARMLPHIRMLALTMHDEDRFLLPVLEAGGSGYVFKSSAATELVSAIRAVQRGEAYLYPSGSELLLRAYRSRLHSNMWRAEELTERERDVLRMTAEGFSNTEIGQQLFLSPKTVDTYRQRVMEKLGIHHRSELVRYALDVGLLTAVDAGSTPVTPVL